MRHSVRSTYTTLALTLPPPQDLSKLLLPVPWASFPTPGEEDPNLLIKLAATKGPQLGLALLATNLKECFLEVLNSPTLARRIQQAMADSQDSQSQSQSAFVGVGEDGERGLRAATEHVLRGVKEGNASVKLVHSGFEVSWLCEAREGQDGPGTKLIGHVVVSRNSTHSASRFRPPSPFNSSSTPSKTSPLPPLPPISLHPFSASRPVLSASSPTTLRTKTNCSRRCRERSTSLDKRSD